MAEWLKLRLLEYFRYSYYDKFIYLNTCTNEVIQKIGFIYYSGFILRTI